MTIILLTILLLLIVIILPRTTGQGNGDSGSPVISRLSTTFLRFPFAVAASAIGTASGVMLFGNTGSPTVWKKLLASALLLLPLLVLSRLLAEKKGHEDFRPDLLTLSIVALGCLYLFLLGDSPNYATWFRHALWTVSAFLSMLLFPFYRRSEEDQSWLFNSSLAYAFAIAFTWAFVLFAGLSAALAGIDYLLAAKLRSNIYLQLWVMMAGYFAVTIFLSAIPSDIRQASTRFRQLKVFEGFIRFVLVPLVALYLVILYAYAGKIILQGAWPKGGVAGFILGFSGVGIVVYLLSHGAGYTANRLQTIFRKFFFPLVLPLTPMLFLSVWRRVSEYGVTEARYLGILSSLWLAAISLYYIFSRRKDFRIIPASLCFIIVLVSFGPWGALSTAARFQTARLKELLQETGILVNGTIQPASKTGNNKAFADIRQVITYLHKIDHISPLAWWSGGNITTADLPDKIVAKLGIPLTENNDYSRVYFEIFAKKEEGIDVSRYHYFWEIGLYRSNSEELSRTIGSTAMLKIKPDDRLQKLRISGTDGKTATMDITLFTEKLLKDLPAIPRHEIVPRKKLTIDLPEIQTRLSISEITGTATDGKPIIHSIKGALMWRGKETGEPHRGRAEKGDRAEWR